MSQVQLATYVTTAKTRFDEDELDFLAEMLKSEIFGALLTASRIRKNEANLNRAELGRRMGKDKAQITRMLRGPSSLKAETISAWANAVEADIAFCLVDRHDRDRIFTGHGVERHSVAIWGDPEEPALSAYVKFIYDMLPGRPQTVTPQFVERLVSAFTSDLKREEQPA
jgi:transcriptional regulator with XRE-family HTH domain